MKMQIAGSMSTGRIAYWHDTRTSKELPRNIDQNMSRYNVTLINKLEEFNGSQDAYINHKMQGVIDEYNVEKIPSRQITTSYTEYRLKNKNLSGSPLMYEAVMQLGSTEDIGGLYYDCVRMNRLDKAEELRHLYTDQYSHMLDEFKAKFPHMDVVGAYIHYDEPGGTPHMHLQYIPFGEQKRGLPLQVSIGRALENDGIERIKSRAEAQELGGYQIAKMYKAVKEDIIEPAIHELMGHFSNVEYEIKPVEHGVQHYEPEVFSRVIKAEKQNQKLKKIKDQEIKEIKESDYYNMASWFAFKEEVRTWLSNADMGAAFEQLEAAANATADRMIGIDDKSLEIDSTTYHNLESEPDLDNDEGLDL